MIQPSELRERAASYRLGGPSAEHTAAMLDKAAIEIERLRAVLGEAFASIGVANAINSVRAEYDFEPIYQRIKSALTKNGS